MLSDEPLVGIFWFVVVEGTQLVTRGCRHQDAEPYGDCLTFPDGHAETWEAWRGRRILLPTPSLHSVIIATEYEVWPRGRIVYEILARRSVIYADAQLLSPLRLARIRSAFALPAGETVARRDLHYSRSIRLPSNKA